MNAAQLQVLQSDALRMLIISCMSYVDVESCEGCPQPPLWQLRASSPALGDL